ncbi:MAG: DNA polymerase III subunit gamma/tau, partial [Cyanobacteria bacterium P01_G01_bin.19]
MPYEPIHHKYRPQTFKDLVGQETIALTLNNALKQEKIAPAYLFTGPRGTGKTSSARILAKSLNCLSTDRPTPEPCGKCEACKAIASGSALDVMEIDAASNTGVDNIREIIERSRFAPVQCRYKIYAIDECHMLSTAAFNALLKTLEEPPPQVVFILATTDPQRVLSTIISRCQRFDYRRIPLPAMVGHLKYIAGEEKIAIADDALTLIAQIANGGLRDAESLLDQLSLFPDEISVEKVWDLVGAVPEQDLLKLLRAINRDDSLGVLEQCRSLLDRGREPIVVLQNLASFYLNLLIAKTAPQRPDMVAVTETCWQQLCEEANNWDTGLIMRGQQQLKSAETQLKRTTQPRLWLEVTLLGLLPQANLNVASNSSSPPKIAVPPTVSDSIETGKVNVRPTNSQAPVAAPDKKLDTPSSAPSIEREKPVEKETIPDRPISNTSAPVQEPAASTTTPTVKPAIPTPKPEPEPTTVSSAETAANDVDLEEIWLKVLNCLQPPTTQALLKQQCHLISFDGSSAIVGISSATLQKLNQRKVPNIEQAFALVVQHKVKVQLEVASKPQDLVKKNPITIHEPPKELKGKPVKPVANTPDSASNNVFSDRHNFAIPVPDSTPSRQPDLAQTNRANPDGDRSTSAAIAANVSVVAANSSTAPIVPNSAEHTTTVPPVPTVQVQPNLDEDYEDSDLDKAIASLTQSFEGELVEMENSLDNALEIGETSNLKTSVEASS